jgi:hypothetical protein
MEELCNAIQNSGNMKMTNITIEESKKIKDFESLAQLWPILQMNSSEVELQISAMSRKRYYLLFTQSCLSHSCSSKEWIPMKLFILREQRDIRITQGMEGVSISNKWINQRGKLTEEYVLRDLLKAYVGFKGVSSDPEFEE